LRTKPLLALPLLAGALLIAGCTSSSTGQSTSSTPAAAPALSTSVAASTTSASTEVRSAPSNAPFAGEHTAITVGVSPSTASAAVYLAAQQEFAEQGLDVTMSTIQSGAEAIPRLLNGELAFALGDAAGTITAASNGIEISATGVATVSPSTPEQDYSSIVATNPDVKGPQDLQGHTVAVNQLNGIAQLTARAAIDNQGGDSSTVNFVELPFPQMNDAVSSGRVDSALVVEPFLSGALAAGMHVVLAPQAYAVAGLPSTIFVSAKSYAEENPDVVKRFDAAMNAAATRANADAAVARQIAGTYSTIPPDVLAKITLPIYAENAGDVQGLNELLALMNKYNVLDQQPEMDTLLFSAAG
jgi:NitT/TauT family transport system substrate-binding protein